MIWPTVVSAVAVLTALVWCHRRLAEMRALAQDGAHALSAAGKPGGSVSVRVRELEQELAAAPTPAHAAAIIDEALIDVQGVLSQRGALFVASARLCLFVGAGGTIASATAHLRGQMFGVTAYVYDATPVSIGVIGFALATLLGRRAGEQATRGCEAWNAWAQRRRSEH